MRHVSTSLAVLLAATLAASAGDVTKLEGPPKAEWRVIQADPVITTLAVAGDKPAKWVLVDEHPAADLRAATDGKTATFAATIDGQFRVLAITGDEVFRVRVVRGKPEVMPPGPDPQPKPPDPKPPAPTDPLVAVFAAAYRLDKREDAAVKAEELKTLAALYEAAADLANDPDIGTTAALVEKIRKASDSKQLKVAGLLDLRKVVAAELKAAFPEDVALNADARKKAADLFTRIKAALEQVK